jgi:3-hydroxyacyl-CoA dehydrogenase
MPVTFERNGGCVVVRLEHPPVNAIGVAERRDLLEAAKAIEADDTILGVVLTGTQKAFAAGADAREFDSPPLPPHLPEVVAAIMSSTKPWIAAISGMALGGGLELALACDSRIAGQATTLGLPEVTLGVVPGAGGTQFLPRLIGFSEAAAMITEGKTVTCARAMQLGLVDEIAADPLRRALELAPSTAKRPLSRVPRPKFDDVAASALEATLAKRMRGQIAPTRALALLKLSGEADVADGLEEERRQFLELRQSEQARALRHIFFAERGAKTSPSLRDVKPRAIERCAVVGGGTMGAGIAYACLQAGMHVQLIETDVDAQQRAVHNVGRLIDGAVSRGTMNDAQAAALRERLSFQVGYERLEDVDLLIEAAYEDMGVKKAIFEQLDRAAPNAILATNTSYLDVDEIAYTVSRPDRVLGLHFFSPAHIMKLLEIVKGAASSDEALASAFAVAAKLKKLPVLAGVCDGFIGNRILAGYREVADILLLEGATPWQVDAAMVEFGYPMGPYEAQDLAGLDIAYANRKRLAHKRDPARRYVRIADRMVEEGRIGKKGSVGWYRYPGGGGAVEDPLVEDLIAEESHFAKVKRRPFTHDEIRRRLLARMIKEAAQILEDGIAQSAADIDLVTVHGYSFPRWRGGLMYYAQEYGLGRVLSDLETFALEDPVLWCPSPGLRRLAGAYQDDAIHRSAWG